MATMQLPNSFLWGGATSDFQCEGGFGEGFGQKCAVAIVITGKNAAEQGVEHELHRDMAGELGDAVLQVLAVAHEQVSGESRIAAAYGGRTHEYDGDPTFVQHGEELADVSGEP